MTEHTFVKIPHYTIYYANNTGGKAGSAIIIKSTLKYYEFEAFITNKIQGTILRLETLSRPTVIVAVYSPPWHSISAEEYVTFITTGDPVLRLSKEKNLLQVIQQNNLSYFSTGEPTF
jgi:hypothetical protein